jgi:hypothetical protein
VWWKAGNGRLKRISRTLARDLPHTQQRGRSQPHTEMWKDEILDKTFRNFDAEINIRRLVECKNRDE